MKELLRIVSVLVLASAFAVQAGAKDYLATEFGARPDGETLNTAPLQAAIDYISTQSSRIRCAVRLIK